MNKDKNQMKNKKRIAKQTVIATASLATVIVPAVTTIFAAPKNISSDKSSFNKAANAAVVSSPASVPPIDENTYGQWLYLIEGGVKLPSEIPQFLTAQRIQQIKDFEAANSVSLASIVSTQASLSGYTTSWVPLSKFPAASSFFATSQSQTSTSSSTSQAFLSTLVPLDNQQFFNATNFLASMQDYSKAQKDLQALLDAAASQVIQGSTTAATLSYQPTFHDSIINTVQDDIRSMSGGAALADSFKFYAMVGTTKIDIQSGSSTIDFKDAIEKAKVANGGQLPDINLYGVFDFGNTPLGMAVQNKLVGAVHTIHGGLNPDSAYSVLASKAGISTSGQTQTIVAQSSSTSPINVGAIAEQRYMNSSNSEAINVMDDLNNILKSLVDTASYSGSTDATIVKLSRAPSQQYINPSSLSTLVGGIWDPYATGAVAKLFYSVGNSQTLHEITSDTFTISGVDSLASRAYIKNGQGPFIPDVHFYLGLNSAQKDPRATSLIGYDRNTSSGASFDFVGTTLTHSSLDSSNNLNAKFKGIKDSISVVDAPVIVNPNNPATMTVNENPAMGIISSTTQNGSLVRKPVIQYEYSIHGSNTWLSKSNFFGVGKPASTPAAQAGIDWRAVEINGALMSATVTTPAGSTKTKSGAATIVTGVLTKASAITKIDAPTFTIGIDSAHYSVLDTTPGAQYRYSVGIANPSTTASNDPNDPFHQYDLFTWDGAADGWDYLQKDIHDANHPASKIYGKPWAFSTEIAQYSSTTQAINLFDVDLGKFRTILWTADANMGALKAHGELHVTPNDLPDATHIAITNSFNAPTLDASSTDSKHIKINTGANTPMNFEYSLDGGKTWTLHLDANGMLVDANNNLVNAWDVNVMRDLSWRLNPQHKTIPGRFVEYVGHQTSQGIIKLGVPKYIEVLSTDKALPKQLPTLDARTTDTMATLFLDVDSKFAVPIEYSIDGINWYDRNNFMKFQAVNGAKFATDVKGLDSNGQRNLWDGTKYRDILYRIKPSVSTNPKAQQYVLDDAAMKALGLKEDHGIYSGVISTSHLAKSIDSRIFETAGNVPTLTGTSTTDYTITAPSTAAANHIKYEFKLQSEGDSLWVDAAAFKTAHANIGINAGGKWQAQTIVWRAVAETGYKLVDSSTTHAGVIDTASQFVPQVLTPQTALQAIVPVKFVEPILKGSNTQTLTISTVPVVGLNFEYSLDGTTWKSVAQFVGSQIIKTDGTKYDKIQWRAVATPGYIIDPSITKTTGDLSTSNIDMAISSIPSALHILQGSKDTQHWTVNDASIRVPGLEYTFTIGTQTYTLQQLKDLAATNTFNLYDETTGSAKQITWNATEKPGYKIVATTPKSGLVTISGIDKLLSTLVAPVIAGAESTSWNLDIKADLTKIDFTYSTDQTTWLSETAFKAAHPNLFDAKTGAPIDVYYKATPKTGYAFASTVVTTAKIDIPTTMTMNGGTIAVPKVQGTSTTDYSLVDRDTHFSFQYRSTTSEQWVTAAAFKTTHPNLYHVSGSMTPIMFQVVADNGYSFQATSGLLDASALIRVVDPSTIPSPTLSTAANNKSSANYSVVLPAQSVAAQIEYRFALSETAPDSEWVDFNTFKSHNPNLYDASTDANKNIFYRAYGSHGIVIDNTEHYAKGMISTSTLLKSIDSISVPHITSTTGRTDAWTFDVPSQHGVSYKFGSGSQEDASVFHAANPNLWDGLTLKPVQWYAVLDAGYTTTTTTTTPTGDFTADEAKLIKVYSSISAPTAVNPSAADFATAFNFSEVKRDGITYLYSLGSETPKNLADFKAAHSTAATSLWDSINHKYFDVTWTASFDSTKYAVIGATTGKMDLSGARSILAKVDPLSFDLTASTSSGDVVVKGIPSMAKYKTEFHIVGSTASWGTLDQTLVDLRDNFNHLPQIGGVSGHTNYNLFDATTNTWKQIEWRISPVDPTDSLDPTQQVTGILDNTGLLKRVIPGQVSISASSTRTSDITFSGLSTAGEYLYSFGNSNDWYEWDDFVINYPNMYDATTGQTQFIKVKLSDKPNSGFKIDESTLYSSTGDGAWYQEVRLTNVPRFIDVVAPLIVTGSSTASYQFAPGSTAGVTYKVSESKTGTFVTLDEFKRLHPNLAALADPDHLWFQVVPIDATYKVDPAVEKGQISVSLLTAIDHVDKPTLDPHKLDSNNFDILFNQQIGVEYTFALEGGTFMSREEFLKTQMSSVFDPLTNSFKRIVWNAKPYVQPGSQGQYVFSSSVTADQRDGFLDTSTLHRVVTSIEAPTLTWAHGADAKSNNWDLVMPTHAVSYMFSLDGGTTWKSYADLKRENLYDATTGNMKELLWKPVALPDVTILSSAIPATNAKVDLSKILLKVIDKVATPTVAGTASATAQGSTLKGDFAFYTTTPHVNIMVADTTAGGGFMKPVDFIAASSNLFNDRTGAVDTLVYSIYTEPGYLIDSSLTNAYNGVITPVSSGIALSTSSLTKVISSIDAPQLSGTAQKWDIVIPSQSGIDYQFRIKGDTTAYVTAAALKLAHPNLDFGGGSHEIEWQAVAQTGYKFEVSPTIVSHGTLAALSSADEVKSVAAPKLAFTDSHIMTLDNSRLTPNLVYAFRLVGETQYQIWSDFRASHTNIYDLTSDSIKNIEWQATPDTSINTNLHITSGVPNTGSIDTSRVDRYIGGIIVPTLENPSANSTELAISSTLTPHIKYEFSYDGGNHWVSKEDLASAYHQLNWDLNSGEISYRAQVASSGNPTYKYVADALTPGKLDVSKIVKVVKPTPPVISGTTRTYTITTTRHVGLNYKIQVDGKAFTSLADFVSSNLDLFDATTSSLHVITWKVEAQPGFKLTPGVPDHGTLDLSQLVTVLDTISAPTVTGTNTKDFDATPLAQYSTLVVFKYSVDKSTWYNTIAELKTHLDNQNLYSVIAQDKLPIYVSVSSTPGSQITHSAQTLTLDTSALISVLDVVPAPTFTSSSTHTDSARYELATPTVNGLKYEYKDSDGTWVTADVFKQHHANLFHIDALGKEVIDDVEWHAQVSDATKFVLDPAAVDHGTLDSSKLVKVITDLGKFSLGAGSKTTSFTVVNSLTGTSTNVSLPGVTFTYSIDGSTWFASVAELISHQAAGFNLFNSLTNTMSSVFIKPVSNSNYEIFSTALPMGANYFDLDLTGIIKVIDNIDATTLPQLSASSKPWAYDFETTELENHYKLDVLYATSATAQPSEWLTEAAFKIAHPNLEVNGQKIDVFYKLVPKQFEADGKTPTNIELASSINSIGQVPLSVDTTISRIEAPRIVAINGNAHPKSNAFAFDTTSSTTQADQNVEFTYSINGGDFKTESELASSGVNLYAALFDHFNSVEYKAVAKPGFIFAPTTSTTGEVRGAVTVPTDMIRVITEFNEPQMEASSTLDYSFTAGRGQAGGLTAALDYKLSVGSSPARTIDELKADNINLWDQLSAGHMIPGANGQTHDSGEQQLSWEVSVKPGYELDVPVAKTHGIIPAFPIATKMIQTVIAPELISPLSEFNSEIWKLDEKYTHGFKFEYSLDGQKWVSGTALHAMLTNGNLFQNDALVNVQWRATKLSGYDFASLDVSGNPVATSGTVVYPDHFVKVLDSVTTPVISGADSEVNSATNKNGYSLDMTFPHVNYLYKLEWEDDSQWVTKAIFESKHANLYSQSSDTIDKISVKAIADTDFEISQVATSTWVLDTSSLNRVISSVTAPTIPAGLSSTHYHFSEKQQAGVSYVYSLSDQGPWLSGSDFVRSIDNANLFDVATSAFKTLHYKIIADSANKYKLSDSITNSEGTINLDSLTKVIDIKPTSPTFKAGVDSQGVAYSIRNWDLNALQTEDWIAAFEFKVDSEDDSQYKSLTAFKTDHPDLTSFANNGDLIQWRAKLDTSKNYMWDPTVVNIGFLDPSNLETRWDTSSTDLKQINISTTLSDVYLFTGFPQITQTAGYNLQWHWGDETSLRPISEFENLGSTGQWPLWDDNVQTTQGTYGQWMHGGSVVFELVPNDPQDKLTDNQHIELNFEQMGLKKVINNKPFTVIDGVHDLHVAGQDDAYGFLPGFDYQDWSTETHVHQASSVNVMPASATSSGQSRNAMTVYNPWVGIAQSDREAIVEKLRGAKYDAALKTFPALYKGYADFDAFKAVITGTELTSSQFYALTLAIGNIYDGSNWIFNAIEIKKVPRDPAHFQVVNSAAVTIWDHNSNSIAKVVDNTQIISDIRAAIRPAAQVGSMHDNVIWGDKSVIQTIIDQAKSQNLVIQIQTKDETGNLVWLDLKDMNDPDDFWNSKLPLNQNDRSLALRVVSTEIDAATGKLDKVMNTAEIDITDETKVKEVLGHIQASWYDTTDIKISGVIDQINNIVKIDEDKLALPNYLETKYRIYDPANHMVTAWMAKDDFITELSQHSQFDRQTIQTRIDIADQFATQYTIGSPIIGSVNVDNLFFGRIITGATLGSTDFITPMRFIKLEGTPTDSQLQTEKTVVISTETQESSILLRDEFKKQFGIQYRINDGTWSMFEAESTDLQQDFTKNLIPHLANTWMPIHMLPSDVIEFRIVPIADPNGNILIGNGIKTADGRETSSLEQSEIAAITGIVTDDWAGSTTFEIKDPSATGTLYKIKAEDILSSGENLLIQWMNNNFEDTNIDMEMLSLIEKYDASAKQLFINKIEKLEALENAQKELSKSREILEEKQLKLEELKLVTSSATPQEIQVANDEYNVALSDYANKDSIVASLAKELEDASKAIVSSMQAIVSTARAAGATAEEILKLQNVTTQFDFSEQSWISPFMELITARPKFEEIKDRIIDPTILQQGQWINLADDKVVSDLVSSNIISKADKTIIDDVKEQYANPKSLAELSASNPEKYHETLDQIYSFILKFAYDPSNNFDIAQITALIKELNDKKLKAWQALPGNAGQLPSTQADIALVATSRSEIIDNAANKYPVLQNAINQRFFSPHQATSIEVINMLIARGEVDLLTRLYEYDNVHKNDLSFNRDLDSTDVDTFELTQLGQGATTETGIAFTHSNTIFFGENAIRFNVSEDADGNRIISEAYLVAQDSTVQEKIARIHLSNVYKVDRMSLVLELENGDIIQLSKSIQNIEINSEALDRETVRFIRLGTKVDEDTKQSLDWRMYGANWKNYSETVYTDVSSMGVTNDRGELAKIAFSWTADTDELLLKTSRNELPFDLDAEYDNKIINSTEDHSIRFGVTPLDIQRGAHETVSTSAIYANIAPASPALIQQAILNTQDHFLLSSAFETQWVYENVISDTQIDGSVIKHGQFVIESHEVVDGTIIKHIRTLDQSIQTITVTNKTIGAVEKADDGKIWGMPKWVVILITTIAGIGVLGGGSYFVYNKIIAKKVGKVRKPKIK